MGKIKIGSRVKTTKENKVGKIKIGSRVKTTKGDRYNPNAKKELLEVIELTNGWKGLESAVCRKENGKVGRFLIKNLVIA